MCEKNGVGEIGAPCTAWGHTVFILIYGCIASSCCTCIVCIWKGCSQSNANSITKQVNVRSLPMDVSGVMSSKKYWVASKAESGSSCSWLISGRKEFRSLSKFKHHSLSFYVFMPIVTFDKLPFSCIYFWDQSDYKQPCENEFSAHAYRWNDATKGSSVCQNVNKSQS